jgi:hypothetical protein
MLNLNFAKEALPMSYIKAKVSDGVSVLAELHDDNVFTRCPGCGREVGIDLAELFGNSGGDLYGTSVYCVECSKGGGAQHGQA